MKRSKEFGVKKANTATFKDSRFGLRRLFLSSQERPRVAAYRTPGKGPNGEHQN